MMNTFLVRGIAPCGDPAHSAQHDKANDRHPDQARDLFRECANDNCEQTGDPAAKRVGDQKSSVGHVAQPGNVAHGIIREEGHHKGDNIERNTLPGRAFIPAIQDLRGDPLFSKWTSVAARQPECHLSAEDQTDPCDQDAAAEAVDISAGDHQSLSGDECEEGLQDEQHGQDSRSPQAVASDRGGDSLGVTEPVQGCGQWLAEDPGCGQS